MKDYLIDCTGRVLVTQKITVRGITYMVPCGHLSMKDLIQAAAYRGSITARDQRATNF